MIPGTAAPALLQAGAASAVITPPLGHFLAGYGRNRPSTGLHDDLYARALVISDGQTRIALVTLDTIGLTRPDIKLIAAAASAQVPGLPQNQIVVSSTHTHAGPDVVGLWGSALWKSGRDAAYMEALRTRVVGVIAQAAARMQPVVSKRCECAGGIRLGHQPQRARLARLANGRH